MITLETLKKFCGTDESRPTLTQPWSWGEYTYATDGRVLIRVPRMEEVALLVVQHGSQLRVDFLFSSDPGDGNYRPIATPPEGGWGILCDNCRGKGRTFNLCCPECNAHFDIATAIACEECDGRGRLLRNIREPFGKHSLNLFYIDKLSLLPLVRLAENKLDAAGELSFLFNGGDGRLMPMKAQDEQTK